MDEYIDRGAAIKSLLNDSPEQVGYSREDAADCIRYMDAADVVPVCHGRWLHTEEPLGWQDVDCMECSACHDSWIIEEDYCFDDMPLWNYCPSCGAKMDGGGDQ